MNTPKNWQCDGWKYIHDANDTQAISDICEMTGLDDETRRENARLICAAPDMLEALSYVMDKIDDEEAFDKCLTAFLKAKGLKRKGKTFTAL